MSVKIKILEVEDEAITAMYMKKKLTRIGYEVTSTVATGEKAILSAKQNPPDVVLMDIRLAGEMDGIDAAFIINTMYNIPIAFITGYDDQIIRERAEIIKPLGFFTKPVDINELKSLIDCI